MTFRPLLTAVLAAGLMPAAALAQAPGQDMPPAPDSTMANIVAELQELREDMRALRAMVEDQQAEIERLSQRQTDQYLDLERRIGQGAGESTPDRLPDERPDEGLTADELTIEPDLPELADDVPEVRPPLDAEPEVTPLGRESIAAPRELEAPSQSEQEAYDTAFRALRELRYADAAEGFDAFLRDYPDSAYAPNAQYWLGEAYYVNRDFDTALTTFQSLLNAYPGSNKEGDALLKIGFSHYELKQWDDARAALEQVRAQHAGTTLARLAENRLQAMRLEGHF